MKLYVKNMVCDRCILAVEGILKNEEIPFHSIIYGEVHLQNELNLNQKQSLIKELPKMGFELIDNRLTTLIENIKHIVMKRARNENGTSHNKQKLSHYLSDQVNHEYTYLSSLFSSIEGKTIENYFIEHRIERAKELLNYGQRSLSQIAFDLDYCSVAHLSNQFKKVTGLTPTCYREMGMVKRKSLDSI